MIEKHIERMKTLFKPGSRIVVAMSGGIDSSLTAALIKRAGFETIGITLQLYRSENISKGKTCCAGKDIQDAKNIAESEGFPHYVLDYTKIFKEKVIDNFVETYEKGETPLPCTRCNQYIKFGEMLNFAEELDANYLVTGHYAQRIDNENGPELHKSQDENKDQSYFLALTTTKQLTKLHFPLASMEKTEVKQLAAEIGLSTANKPESQDICFIPDGDYVSFLQKLRPEMFVAGNIITKDGEILGRHNGLAQYTVGQRKGLNLANGPWYVMKLEPASNNLIISKLEDLEEQQVKLTDISLLVEKEYFTKPIDIKIRARHTAAAGIFDPKTNIITFKEPQTAIAPGQICAFYDKSRLLGGGVILSKEK